MRSCKLEVVGVGVLARSSTPCRSCRQFEQSRVRNVLDALAETLHQPSAVEAFATAHRNLLAAFAGSIDWWVVNPYAMHRKAYVSTGDEIEKERMLRHVTADSSDA